MGTLDRAAAEEKLRALFGDTICTALAAPAWKERLETMTLLADQVLRPPSWQPCLQSVQYCSEWLQNWRTCAATIRAMER